jgi:hypothetical protein
VACSDGPRVLIYPSLDPPDAARDGAAPDADRVTPEEECAGREGLSCPLPNAAGICVEGSCQLVACSLGFADCSEASPGCERSVMLESRCGGCDTECRDGEACQLSPRGYVCSAGVVCLPGEFDLDREAANGCEWRADDPTDSATQPEGFFRVQAAAFGPGRALFAAGTNDDARFVVGPDTEGPSPVTIGGEALAPAPAVAIASNADHGYVLWEDRITRHEVEDGSGAVALEGPCAGTPSRELVAAAADPSGRVAAATGSAVGLIEDPTRVFDETGYRRAFSPYVVAPEVAAPERFAFDAAEVAECASCVLDPDTGVLLDDPRCDGPRACRPAGFDAQACGACAEQASTGCPSFFPVDLDYDARTGLWFVTTRRGVVALARDAQGWRALARAETAYRPGVTPGAQFVAGAVGSTADGARVFLLHAQGYVRALDVARDGDEVTLSPAGADVGLPIAIDAARPVMGALGDRFVALGDTDRVLVLSWTQRSARMFQLVEEGIGVPTMLALEPDPLNPDGFIEARELFATLQRREVYVGERVPDPDVPDVGAPDAGGADAGVMDAGVMDAGPTDAGADGGATDAGAPRSDGGL